MESRQLSGRRIRERRIAERRIFDHRGSGAWRGANPATRPGERGASESRFQARDFRGVHLREAEALLAEVFEGGADQVEVAVVDDEKAVVEVLAEALFTSRSTNARASHSWPS